MSAARERAKALAGEIKETMTQIRAAEARVRQLSQELKLALELARGEEEAALTVIEYPSGRYECASCGLNTMFTEATRDLPACENCGHRNYVGHEPVVKRIEAPTPPKFPVGMYECVRCGGRAVVAVESDELSACELCGFADFKPAA
jgi:DNA-directed RNA polymerase subunit RPC12/RpoP